MEMDHAARPCPELAAGKKSAGDSSILFSRAQARRAGAASFGINPPVPPRSFEYIQRYTRETCFPVISAAFSMPIFAMTDRAGSRCVSLMVAMFAIIASLCQAKFANSAIGKFATLANITQ